MIKHLHYLKYVLTHKWFVMILCFKEGLIWRGLVHDMSKFLPSEWFPYVEFFHGPNGVKNDNGPSPKTKERFKRAVDLHYSRNRHHADHWKQTFQDFNRAEMTYCPIMGKRDVMEMLCDWHAAGRTQVGPTHAGWGQVAEWFRENKNKIPLHPITRTGVELAIALRARGGSSR